MKDEEMANRFREDLVCSTKRLIGRENYEYIEQAFLAGLKAGRPQWHDLRENPKDLPKKNKSYWVYVDCQGNKIYRSIVWQGCWCGWNGIPLAWCEEPTFDKE